MSGLIEEKLFLVRIFPHWDQKNTRYLDTFHAVLILDYF